MTQNEIIDQMARVQFMSGVAFGIALASFIFSVLWLFLKVDKDKNG